MEFSPRIERFSTDATCLGEMLGCFKRECSDFLEGKGGPLEAYDHRKGWQRNLADGRDCVTQIPHDREATARSLLRQPSHDTGGGQPSRGRELHFVGFFGRVRSDLEQHVLERISKLTYDLMATLPDYPDMIFYGFAELKERDGNYYNLVITRQDSSGQEWAGVPLHQHEAINKLSPEYYYTVRIHTGVLPDGIDSKELLLKRSVFLDYQAHQKDPNEPIQREEKNWTD